MLFFQVQYHYMLRIETFYIETTDLIHPVNICQYSNTFFHVPLHMNYKYTFYKLQYLGQYDFKKIPI